MKKYYHFTNYNNLENISKNGLVPQNGIRCQSIGDKKCAIFFSFGINNAILLYTNLLYYYNTHSGETGKELIDSYEKKIKACRKNINEAKPNIKKIKEIESMIDMLEATKKTMQYESFDEYLGDGVYLMFKDIPNVINSYPEDCYTYDVIPPEGINVLVLVNKNTGEIIDDREKILNYFLSIVPIYRFTRNIYNTLSLETVKKLYIERQDLMLIYNPYNFKYQEMKLSEYLDYKKGKIKELK